jgi:hypothetical protein
MKKFWILDIKFVQQKSRSILGILDLEFDLRAR